MAELRVNPTRMELKRLKARLTTARRGHKLLKDKRDELMKQFIELVRENRALRIRVEEKLAAVHASFGAASAAMSPEVLEEALLVPKREGSLDVSYRNMMSCWSRNTASTSTNRIPGTQLPTALPSPPTSWTKPPGSLPPCCRTF